ncbi:14176_t:CDS:2 [Acaulospora morrowiae]|uniref:14176_t:CDS:1 n=1 Tax=Acaulospora morrowiae TaxID=94023 RepID=A0A9N8ZZ84_9GLOM|nr:14176_t:CDS:2 [Acaulospora morrowiae]
MSSYASIEDKANIDVVSSNLKTLLNNPIAITSLTLEEKTELVSSLIFDLDENGIQKKWNDDVKLLALQALKTLGRDAKGCDLLFSELGFKVLLYHATILPNTINAVDKPVSQEALTCIANALLLKESTRDLFDRYDGVLNVCQSLKDTTLSIKTQFLISRILFLMTIKPSQTVVKLVDNFGIYDILYKSLCVHVSALSSRTPVTETSPITKAMVLNEQLKFLFNVMINYPKVERDGRLNEIQNSSKFEKLLQPVIDVVLKIPPPSPLPLGPPHSHAIHALLNFPVAPHKKIWFPPEKKSQQYELLDQLLEILKSMIFTAIQGDPDSNIDRNSKYGVDFDEVITPLVALLKKLAEEDELAKTMERNRLLPDDVDRSKPLEKGDSISARLIRLMTSVMLPNLKDSVSELFFVLCDQDANVFIHHVGYGNGAGFLMSRNIMIPSTSSIYNSDKSINPITGQYFEDEPPSLSDMTDEEKEREAEKLFVLFERLKKTGVMNVVNPVEEAMRSGKLQEMNDENKDDESD